MSYLVEQLPYCDLLRLSPLTGWFVLSVRQVVRLRVVKKKQSSFASCDWALLFYLPNFFLARLNKGLTSETFFSPSQVRFVELSDNAKILPKCRETWLVLFSTTGKAENLSKCRQAWLILFRRFCERKKIPSQSSLAHKLMSSGFFYLPKVSEKLPQPGCISIRLMYSGFFYLPPFKMIFNIKERK